MKKKKQNKEKKEFDVHPKGYVPQLFEENNHMHSEYWFDVIYLQKLLLPRRSECEIIFLQDSLMGWGSCEIGLNKIIESIETLISPL